MNISTSSFEPVSTSSFKKTSLPAKANPVTLTVPLARVDSASGMEAYSLRECVSPAIETRKQEKPNGKSQRGELLITEEHYFSALKENGRDMHLYLLNGIKLRGRVVSDTEFCVFLVQSGANSTLANTSLIYKSAIASVVPIAFG